MALQLAIESSLLLRRCRVGDGPDGGEHDDKGTDAEPPVHAELRQGGRAQSVDAPGHGTAGGLEGLVGTDQDGGASGRVRLGADEPVAVALPQRVVGSVEDVEEDGSGGQRAVGVVNVLLETKRPARVRPQLESVAAAPDRHAGNHEESPAHLGAHVSREEGHVEDGTDDQSTEHLSNPVQRAVERAGADVEGEAVHVVLLVRVENIRREEQREHAQYPPVAHGVEGNLQGTGKRVLLGLRRGMELSQANALGRADEKTEHPTNQHDDHESDVGRVGDRARFRVVVETERREGADTAAEVEDDPKHSDGASLLRFRYVGGHDGALHDPQKRSTYAEDGTCGDHEAAILGVLQVLSGSPFPKRGPARLGSLDVGPHLRLKFNKLPLYRA